MAHKTNARLPDGMYNDAKAFCDLHGISFNALVCLSVRRFLNLCASKTMPAPRETSVRTR